MPGTFPSAQSFYENKVPEGREISPHSPAKKGDGFTEAELADGLDPLSRKWNPEREYEEVSISQLVPGPRAITFMGRIVYLNTYFGHSSKQPKAAGFHSLIVKDDYAAITVCFLSSPLNPSS